VHRRLSLFSLETCLTLVFTSLEIPITKLQAFLTLVEHDCNPGPHLETSPTNHFLLLCDSSSHDVVNECILRISVEDLGN